MNNNIIKKQNMRIMFFSLYFMCLFLCCFIHNAHAASLSFEDYCLIEELRTKAYLLSEQGNYRDATRLLDKALTLDPLNRKTFNDFDQIAQQFFCQVRYGHFVEDPKVKIKEIERYVARIQRFNLYASSNKKILFYSLMFGFCIIGIAVDCLLSYILKNCGYMI